MLPILARATIILIACLVFSCGNGSVTHTEAREITVYVTLTGKKYHRSFCRYLRLSKSPVSLADANMRLGPCAACKPQKVAGQE